MQATSPYESPVEPPSRPLGRRIVDTFFAPGDLFASFGERPPWLLPVLIAMVVTAVGFFLLPTDLYVEQMRDQLRSNPEAGRAMDPESMAKWGRLSGAVFGPLGMLLGVFLTAGILALVFRVIMSGQAGFRQYLGVAGHASLITALGTVVMVPLWIATGDMQTRLSLALLTPFLEPTNLLHRVLQGIDVFGLWWIAVLALGVSVLNRKCSWGTAAAIVFGVYLLFLIGGATLATLFQR